MSRRALATAAVLTLLCAIGVATQQSVAAEPLAKPAADAPLVVSLRLTVEEYDPQNPAGEIACSVENRSDAPISLPNGYDGMQVVLNSGRVHLWARAVRPAAGAKQGADDAPAAGQLASGETAELFKLSLAEILTDVEKRDGRYGWNWMRRPEPPTSPIHRWREPGYLASANFKVELKVADQKYGSNVVELQVKPSDEP